MRRYGLLYAAIALAVIGVALIIHSQELDALPVTFGPSEPATPVVIEITHDVLVTATPSEVPTLSPWQMATQTPAPDYRWATATVATDCAWALREGCTWTTPQPAPTSARMPGETP